MNDTPGRPGPRSAHGWTWLAVLLFVTATGLITYPLFEAGITRTTPRGNPQFVGDDMGRLLQQMDRADHEFHVWLVNRGARALTLHPWRVFDAEHCYPSKNSLAFGENLLTMSVLAIPAYWLSGEDPELTYNVMMILSLLISAAAMFLLVRRWTASPPAAIVAATFYAFHQTRLADTTHYFSYDTAWMVLAMYFADRTFDQRRWKDAIGLALSGALQLGTGLYPVLGGILIALPFALWLGIHYRFSRLVVAQLAFVGVIVGATAVFVYSPYLELRKSGILEAREAQGFATWGQFAPGGSLFPGWPGLLLAVAGLVLPGRSGRSRWPLKLALATGAVLALLAATGPNAMSGAGANSPWELLKRAIPGLDNIRAILRLSTQAHTVAGILAGFGTAAVLQRIRAPRAALVAAYLLIVAVAADVLRVWIPGTGSQVAFYPHATQPPDADIDFYRVLAAYTDGPIFEWPHGVGLGVIHYSPRLILAAYHKRPTSTCFGSYLPDERRVAGIKAMLPATPAVVALGVDGFTTLVVHHDAEHRAEILRLFDSQDVEHGGLLRKVVTAERMTAYRIETQAELVGSG